MVKRLNRTVLAGGEVLPAGTVWTERLATVPDRFWDGADAAEPGSAPDVEQPEPLAEPPRAGRGSSAAAWREHARALGIEVPDDAGRDDVIAAVDAAAEEA